MGEVQLHWDSDFEHHYHTCRRCGDEIKCYGEGVPYVGCEAWDGDNDGCICERMED